MILLFSLFVVFGIYYLVDVVWNGTFVNWFTNNYTSVHEVYMEEIGDFTIVREINWYKVKPLLLVLLSVIIVLWTATAIVTSYFYAKKKTTATVTQTSQMIRAYMTGEKDAADIFPKEYAEISTQMAEIKTIMQRNEQFLKDEASRKNDLITYLAHDLKTPLTSVLGYLSLLDEAPDMPAEQKAKYVHITLDKANRLDLLINEFFEITRYNLQQIDLENEQIDLYYMLVQMTDEFYPILNAHGNTTTLQAAEELSIYGDSIKLARVFNNILKNAIAYSYPNTPIKIRVISTAQQVSIIFQNSGKTIPKQKLESIFEKFFRLDDARTTNTGGAGLGLAIAKEIVTLHAGTITAASENELTTFSVTLPNR